MSALDSRALPVSARIWGTVLGSDGASVVIAGLERLARLGDRIEIDAGSGAMAGEIVALGARTVTAMMMAQPRGLASGLRAYLVAQEAPRPSAAWLGLVVDAFGRLADGSMAPEGDAPVALGAPPPRGDRRRPLGPRLSTGLAAFDTFLPLCRGQRIGVFAGSGVGKSMLMAALARGVAADVVVIGLIGERGREVGEFARGLLGPAALARSVVIAATSDQTALVKRRAGLLTLATAEYFRDQGAQVLCLFDSVTRFAEAHREIALAAGEAPALRAYPPSTAPTIAQLCERAGPGEEGTDTGDITAIFTVLVAGSDMEEPVADMVRGVLDGHVILDREIAERGRFPAINLRRSVSRTAPGAWSPEETALCLRARKLIAVYEEAAPMVQAGLYSPGADPSLDEAVRLWPQLDHFIGQSMEGKTDRDSFARLATIINSGRPGR